MTTYVCPKGHQSEDADYCSECGAKLQASAPPAPSPNGAVSKGETKKCPDCGTPHALSEGVFCEVCGYNFETGAHGEIPLPAAPEPVVSEPAVPEPPPAVEAAVAASWEVTISVDPSLRSAESPEPPPAEPPKVLTLISGDHLIGRTSERRAIHPEIALDLDEAISHRHALLKVESAGLTLRDLGSSNGTLLNGKEVQPLVDLLLKDGDQITLGHWTRIAVRAVS